VKRKKITHKHIAKVRKAYRTREETRHQVRDPYESLVSDFVSTVSHELRTPLAIMKQGLSLISGELLGPVTSKQHHALKLSLNSIDRLGRLVNDLLDMSRLEKGKVKLHKKVFNLLGLIEELAEEFNDLAKERGKHFVCEVITDQEEVLVYADADKITQVLVNLLQNAFKFTPVEKQVKLTVMDKAGKVYMSVSDQGVGIDDKDLPFIFKKFHQVKRGESGKPGLGLGLSIAERLVKLHGGEINVKSKLGQGTEFAIKMPLAIPFLTSIVKLVRRESLSKKELNALRKFGLIRLLMLTMEYTSLDVDEKEELLEALQEIGMHRGTLPSIWDHIEDFRRVEIKDKRGRSLNAENYKEAFLMAYIEKNMGEFKYKSKPIYKYGNTHGKRLALMSLVKELSAERLDQMLQGIEGV